MNYNNIPLLEIPDNTNYWIMRASGGKFAEDFELNKRITLNSENIPLNSVNKNYNNFRNIFEEHRLNEIRNGNDLSNSAQSITISAKKIFNFVHSMKNGDIILVPTYKSQFFLVGIVTSKTKQTDNASNSNLSDKNVNGDRIPISNDKFYRSVNWLSKVPRYKIDSSLLYTLTMHQTLIKIDENTNHIDNLVSPFHIKNGNLNLSLRVNKQNEISSEEWEQFYLHLNKIKKPNENIAVKTNVQSPGNLDLSTVLSNVDNGILIMLAAIFITGGNIELGPVSFKVNGLLHYAKNLTSSKKDKTNKNDVDEITKEENEVNEPNTKEDVSRRIEINSTTEEVKQNAREMIHTLDLTIDDLNKLVQNSSKTTNSSEDEEE
ncbi:hypothetical protein [Staphylococcus equorum]|uniref:hypothetical protein n=1 Tax=Staphylococcus equorum TaxID=246432 RepID=UPI002DBE7001|nr:hypothetical protein [Staphylococcus equorum]MEB7675178.1 hypothetical protein [Staphylococcus equorum]